MKEITKKYSNEEITVVWKPHLCIHSAICFKGLPSVFDPRVKPWVNITGSDSETIVAQVLKCPSGALSIEKMDSEINNKTINGMEKNETIKIQVMSKGPLMIKGNCIMVDENGVETLKEGQVALCRCGASSKKPFCDGSHRNVTTL